MSDYERVLDILQEEPGTLVLTANNRQARALIDSLHQRQKASVMAYPQIYAFDAFIQAWFEQAQLQQALDMRRRLLNSTELWLIFDRLLQEEHLPQSKHLARELMRAYNIVEHYTLPLQSAAFHQNEQTRLFARLALLARQTYQKAKRISRAEFIHHAIQTGIGISNHRVLWFGFDVLLPMQQSLQDYFESLGLAQDELTLTALASPNKTYAFDKPETELEAALAWAQEQAQIGQKVAIVIPTLAARLDAIEDLLAKRLPPQSYSISMGRPLAQYGIVQAALSLLHNIGQTDEGKAFRAVCRSSFIFGSVSHKIVRGELSLHPKLFREGRLDKTFLETWLPKTDKSLHKILRALPTSPKSGSAQVWHDYFYAALQAVGFPGDAHISSESMQCLMQFQSVLDEFKQSGSLYTEYNAAQAFSLLEHMLDNRIFQTQKAQAAIEILGLLEASGLRFDGVWVLGLDSDCLPKACRPNPFLPLSLQREYETPYASADKELKLAQNLLRRFAYLNPNTVFSFAKTNQDGHAEPSPLLQHHTIQHPTVALAKKPRVRAEVEAIQENFHLPPEEAIHKMSNRLLEQQATCPFQAFASGRLQTEIDANPEESLSKREKGALLHKALEHLWQAIGNQETLLALGAGDKEQHIQNAVTKACQSIKNTTNPFLQQTEQAYLETLLHKLLVFEESRPGFHVHGMEASNDIEINGVRFHLRIDRIDMGIRQKPIVIDYKTSIPTKLPWKEERPRKPQMLLYALTDKTIDCLFFLGLENGNWVCSGVASKEAAFHPDITVLDDFRAQRNLWQSRIEMLISEYTQGIATPLPIDKQACTYCPYGSLCRYPLQQTQAEAL